MPTFSKSHVALLLRRIGALPVVVLAVSALATSVQGCMGDTEDDGTSDSRLTDGYGGYGYGGYGYEDYGGYGGYGYGGYGYEDYGGYGGYGGY